MHWAFHGPWFSTEVLLVDSSTHFPNLDESPLVLFFPNLSLARRDARFIRRVAWYDSSVSAAIDDVLFADVVFIKQSASEARNADKKAAWISFFSRCLPQCSNASTAFQLGTGCFIVWQNISFIHVQIGKTFLSCL